MPTMPIRQWSTCVAGVRALSAPSFLCCCISAPQHSHTRWGSSTHPGTVPSQVDVACDQAAAATVTLSAKPFNVTCDLKEQAFSSASSGQLITLQGVECLLGLLCFFFVFFYCRHWLFISVYLSSQIEDHLSTFPKKEIGSDRCSLISLSEMTKALLLPHPPLPSPPPSLSLPLCSALMVFACRPDTTGPLHVSTADIMSFGVSL